MEPGLTPDDLVAVAAGGWGYAEAAWLDGWHLRASASFTRRANSAWPLSAPYEQNEQSERALRQTLRAVYDWYTERDLPSLVQCVVGSDLDLAITAYGYDRVEVVALRQVARLSAVIDALNQGPATVPAATSAPSDTDIALSDRPSAAWMKIYRSGSLPAVAEQVLGTGQPNIRFATALAADGSALAIGRVALAVPPSAPGTPGIPGTPGTDGPVRWAGLSAVETAPAARRRGLAKSAIRELCSWAATQGATDVFLEVTPSNLPAIELYRSLGFETHHAYHYRVIESRTV